ncbi:MAG: hypothetical protein SOU19_01035 [Candidatus Caccosoma sp.]|nr:hypothetical protein [Candidatus Caccosoma sp.]
MERNEEDLLIKLSECNEKEEYKKGLDLIKDNEDIIVKKYYDVTKYKILFLMGLNKNIDALLIIKNELDVPYVPKDFLAFLNEKQKEINIILSDKTNKTLSYDEIANIDLVDEKTLIRMLSRLKEFNLNGLVNKFQSIFNNGSISSLTKTLLIATLSDYKLDYDFTIVKNGVLIKFNPKTVKDIRENENYIYLERKLIDTNDLTINEIDLLKRLYMTYLLDIYPLIVSENYCDDIYTAVYLLASNMLNIPLSNDFLDKNYNSNKKNVDKIIERINILLESI